MFCPLCAAATEANQKFCSQCGTPVVSPASTDSRADPAASPRPRRHDSIRTFWRRLSDGIELHQLWAQFQSEARASYRLYSREVDWNRAQGESGSKRFIRVVKALFWAMVLKLSPGRRVLFVIALVLLVFPGFQIHSGNFNFEMPNLAFLGALALLILLALELADRVTMKRDLEIAREIQSWLMPSQPPQAPGVDIAFATRAANTVAGDYYDAFFLPCSAAPAETEAAQDRSRLLLVVADVAGKSIPAALLMATLQASLRTLAALSPSLPDLVRRLNLYACDQNLGRQRFTTAFIAEWDTATGCFTYVNAGHNWPVLRRTSGALERLQTGGLPLGIKGDLCYECGNTKLDPGDLLLTFTDGLIEAENDREEEYGEERMLANIVAAAPAATAKDLLSQIMASVDAFVGFAPQHDDITCLVIRAGNPR